MSNVIELNPVREGESSFMLCDCVEGGSPFLLCVSAQEYPEIRSLVCMECEQEIPVTDGFVGA